MTLAQRIFLPLVLALSLGSCRNPLDVRGEFLAGTSRNRQIGIVLDSAGRSLLLFQLGNPERQESINLPGNGAATPVDFAIRNYDAAVALGDAGAVALVDLAVDSNDRRTDRLAAFPGEGRVTAVAFVNQDTVLAADAAGTVAQIAFADGVGSTARTVAVASGARKILVALDRAYVLSDNSGGEGVITVLNSHTLEVLATVPTGGRNPRDMTLGSADRLFVINAGESPVGGSLSLISALNAELRETIPGMGTEPSRVFADARGRVYISSRAYGTLVWDVRRRDFLEDHGPGRPVCDAPCRGATDTRSNEQGDLYQLTPGNGGASRVRIWSYREGEGYRNPDDGPASIAAGGYATRIQIRQFAR
ncbi:hypothetical protein BH23GEM5_BH23GEM5_06540 [soil metagenome]